MFFIYKIFLVNPLQMQQKSEYGAKAFYFKPFLALALLEDDRSAMFETTIYFAFPLS